VLVDGDVEMARVVVTGTLTATFGGIEGTGRLPDRSGGDHPTSAMARWSRRGEIADIAALRAQVAEP
jgi:hypothetical protein